MVRIFKTEGSPKKTYYAVTGLKFNGTEGSVEMALLEVARAKKESTKNLRDRYDAVAGVIAKYKEGLDGLWYVGEYKGKGFTPCMIVERK